MVRTRLSFTPRLNMFFTNRLFIDFAVNILESAGDLNSLRLKSYQELGEIIEVVVT